MCFCCKIETENDENEANDTVLNNLKGDDRYINYEQLASGGTSNVYKVFDIQFSTERICKKIKKIHFRKAFREITILKKIKKFNSKYLVELIDVVTTPSYVKIIMPYDNSIDLHYLFFEKNSFELQSVYPFKKSNIMKQMALCIRELHRFNFTHLDIKLENYIITINGQVKLIDYGTTHHKSPKKNFLKSTVGTKAYSSPEIYDNMYHTNSDIWSLGICYWMLFFNCMCFNHNELYKNKYDQYSKLQFFHFPNEFHLEKMNGCNLLLIDFFTSIFQIDPNTRLDINKIINFEFEKYIHEVNKYLK